MRKLATIRKIDELNPIEGADKIEVATVGGWKVVAQKGLYNVGDLAVYFEIDSWIPNTLAPFLTKPGQHPKVFEGIEGERLRTIKLRGQISQGLLMPLEEACKNIESELFEGLDVTLPLGILKWEKAIPAQLSGLVKGNFPTQIPKTDQERVQNLKKELASCVDAVFEVTEKLEGSSMTCYKIDGVFGVCSRNLDLKRDENNSFWKTAIEMDVENKMAFSDNFAIQGELIGPGVQGNIYGLNRLEFRVFDIYDIKEGKYLNPADREDIIKRMGLDHVPIIFHGFELDVGIDELLTMAEGKSFLAEVEREGLVFKEVNGGITFKAISNKYLLGEK